MSPEASSIPDQGEEVAFKTEATTPAKLAETLVAFANRSGGTLYVGIDPSSGQARSLSDPDSVLDKALKAALSTNPPLIIPMPKVSPVGDKHVLAITVPPGLPHVYSYKGRYLTRDGVRNRPLGPRRLRILMMERGAASFESLMPEDARLEDLDWDKVNAYQAKLSAPPDVKTEELLLQRGCLAMSDSQLRPTYAGLLLFGRNPQQWLPSSEILVVRYPGQSMVDRYVREQVRGSLPEQIRQAEAFVVSNMRRGVRLEGLERVEENEYPVDAVREALVNAVAHRDYQIRGDEIRVMFFANRVSFYSPGRLPGHVTIDNLIDERFSRNEAIVQVLSDMGFIERLGYGVDRMIRLMASAGLPPPQFEEKAAGFQVTLWGHGESLINGAGARDWHHLDLNERQETALAHLADQGRITNRDYQELCPQVSPETIRRDLADLVHKNLLLKIGDKRATYYIFK